MTPLELSYELACSPAHAFEVWTTRMPSWWPKGHSVSHDPATVVSLEGYVGGRLLETTSSGEVIVFGEVTEWAPPRSFSYRWHIGRSRDEATDVTITFDPGPSGTLLSIRQTGWERLGAEAATYREANAGGWTALLPSYLAAVSSAAP
ncbi:MAG: Activator of Hsp90 ATPase 1 family protein [Frankiales bacterium]|nr:Activator of Hsp90 ATPase 1 family protein [Frankiales bacterium]